MSDVRAGTLTPTGIFKQCRRFVESLSHAAYTYQGEEREINLYRYDVDQNLVRIYVYFEGALDGDITNVRIIDKDGDVVAQSDEVHSKLSDLGYYVAFKYKVIEEVVDNIDNI